MPNINVTYRRNRTPETNTHLLQDGEEICRELGRFCVPSEMEPFRTFEVWTLNICTSLKGSRRRRHRNINRVLSQADEGSTSGTLCDSDS